MDESSVTSKPIRVRITREVRLPDPVRLARYEKSPDLGPKILFFSGGTALREVSTSLIRYTYNSIHIVTPFDSGGSSAKLREAFHMPAIGDVRNRLMALADRSLLGNHEIFALFAHRLPKKGRPDTLHKEVNRLAKGNHRLVADIQDPMRKIIRHHLSVLLEKMPEDFDLRGASIGNLVLAAGYLENRRHMDPVIFMFSKLVQVRGIVRPVVNRYLHLIAELENGERVKGQHLLTGKEVPPITSKVARVYLSEDVVDAQEVQTAIRSKMEQLIAQADLICYPMGSFYSSLIANFLPKGVGRAVKQNPCPKVYIPSTGIDPETYGFSVKEQVEALVGYLKKDDPGHMRTEDVLNFVLLDTEERNYGRKISRNGMERLGVEVIHCPLVTRKSAPYVDAERLVPLLLSFA